MRTINFENILEDFNFLENWEDKYRYIIDIGKELEKYPEEFRNEDYRVIGCASQVWFYPEIVEINGQKIFSFKGDSDAMIVRGLIKILTTIYLEKLIYTPLRVMSINLLLFKKEVGQQIKAFYINKQKRF